MDFKTIRYVLTPAGDVLDDFITPIAVIGEIRLVCHLLR